MTFDFSTLVTDRTQQDVAYARQLAEKLVAGTATDAEKAEWNSFTLKGAYNHTDLNRVTAALEELKLRLESYGYAVPGYQRIEVPHILPEVKPTSRLPEGYLELTYIESTGTQYIDTGYKPNNKSKAVVDAQFTEMPSAHSVLIGALEGTTYWYLYYRISNNQYRGRFGTQGEKAVAYPDPTIRTTVENGPDGFKCGDTVSTWNEHEFQLQYSAYLFARSNDGKVVSQAVSCRIFSCQIYEGNTLVRDFVPCINPNGKVGMYDIVTKSFFGNSGTGAFISGARVGIVLPEEYTRVEYIESTGTQYIDTGVSAPNGFYIECDVSFSGFNSGYNVLFGSHDTNNPYYRNYLSASGSGTWELGAYEYQAFGSVSANTDYHIEVCTISGSIFCSINGVNQGVSGSIATTAQRSSLNVYLFGMNYSGGLNLSKMKLKNGLKLYLDSSKTNLVRDFVPCKNQSGVYGLYDLANNVFYQNAGSGVFTAGEEVASPATSSVMVAPGNADEYDPYTWYEFDWPTPEAMTMYLLNVDAIRTVLSVLQSTPRVPPDMEKLMVKEANDIEQIVLDVYRQITIMSTTFIACGEALCGGDNL